MASPVFRDRYAGGCWSRLTPGRAYCIIFITEAWPSGCRRQGGAAARQRKGAKHGSVAEWLKAAVLKTAVPKGTRGSNPLASARLRQYKPSKEEAASGEPDKENP